MIMVYVPEGPFEMGDGWISDNYEYSSPVNTVNVAAFWIDQTEITNARYNLCVKAGDCSLPKITWSYTRPDYYSNPRYENYPVIGVDWNMARAYCTWAGRRLPTEAEWEKAARGTDGRPYPWGKDLDCTRANYWGCEEDTVAVGSYPDSASPYGVDDMVGNVSEWVSSLDFTYPYTFGDGREDLSAPGPRVQRGGAWATGESQANPTLRLHSDPTIFKNTVGFRCVRDAQP
jgi:eukaryotic-like serine/threonine-protein kinase